MMIKNNLYRKKNSFVAIEREFYKELANEFIIIKEKSEAFESLLYYLKMFIASTIILIVFLCALANAEDGKTMTKEYEGFRSNIYVCPAGFKSIGYGFNITEDTIKILLPKDVVSGNCPISKNEADKVFDEIYAKAYEDARKYLGDETFDSLSQLKRDIIVDMAYNLGYSKLSKFKRMKVAIVFGNFEEAAKEMKASKWYKQTGRRAKHHVQNFSK